MNKDGRVAVKLCNRDDVPKARRYKLSRRRQLGYHCTHATRARARAHTPRASADNSPENNRR